MYPNPGYFPSTQPMMQQPQQQMSYDPAFMQNIIVAVQTALAQKGVDQSIANALLANINPSNPAQPVQTSVARLNAYVTQYLQKKGWLQPNRPIRNEELIEAVWQWVDASVAKICANMQQQQYAQQPGNFGYAGGYGQPTRPFPGMYPAGQQPVMMGQPQMGMGMGGYSAVPPGYNPQGGGMPMYPGQEMQSPYQHASTMGGVDDNSPSSLYGKKPAVGNPTNPPAFGTGLVNKPQTPSVSDFVYGDNKPAPTTPAYKPVDFTKTGPVAPAPAPAVETSSQMNFLFKELPSDDLFEDLKDVGVNLLGESIYFCANEGIEGTVSGLQLKTTQADDMQAYKAIRDRLPEKMIGDGEFFHTVEYKRVRAIPIATTSFMTIRDHLITAPKQNWDTLVNILDHKTTHNVAVEVDKFLTELINQKLEAKFRLESSLGEILSIDSIFDVIELREGKFGGKLREYSQWHELVSAILNEIVERIFINADYVHQSEKDLSDIVKCDDVTITLGNLDKYSLGFAEGETAQALKTEVFANYTVLRLNHFFAVTNTLSEGDLKAEDITPGSDTVGERMFWTMFDTAYSIGKRLPGAMFFVKDNSLDVDNIIDYRHSFGTLEQRKLHYVTPTAPNTVR